MRGMVLTHYERPLELAELPERPLGPHEVRLRVEAAALCASDVHAREGGYAEAGGRFDALVPPIVLGHQIAGRVEQRGSAVESVELGQACVVYCYLFCGRCLRCLEGRQNLCERVAKRIGFEVPGGFAESVVVPEGNVFPLPSGLAPPEASVLPDAVATSYHAVVRRGRVQRGERVVVLGVGAVGLYAVRVSALRGARVLAFDRIDDARLEWARAFGAVEAVSEPSGIRPEPELLARVLDRLGGPADVVIDVVGSAETLAAAAELLREGGRLVLVGVAARGELPLARFARRRIAVITSLASTPADLLEVLELARRGEVEPVVADVVALEDLNTAMEQLAGGDVVGRLVAVPS
jgi:alcohol dehydrogenase, propanol-preferring